MRDPRAISRATPRAPPRVPALTALPSISPKPPSQAPPRLGRVPGPPPARLPARPRDGEPRRPPEADAEDTPEARVGNAIAEFADAGFPSEEGDAVDPVSRTKAMNGAVDDLNVLMDAESEVLGQAFELLEKMGIKGLEKPPGREERDAVDEDA